MVRSDLLTTSPNGIVPVEVTCIELVNDLNSVYDMLTAGTFCWYGDELAFLNSILISNGIHYC